ncbi:hypothetical protein KBD87_00720 [Candidatus Saccharibacteria bacterium]|jgi:hypothetical protein|nr:hypothetical protein [Candidatus Saccharibacteria bacterium]
MSRILWVIGAIMALSSIMTAMHIDTTTPQNILIGAGIILMSVVAEKDR